jgi:hypothetical protein
MVRLEASRTGGSAMKALLVIALAQAPEAAPLPAVNRIDGPFWTWVLPALLFALSLAATLFLYRRFTRD